MDSIKGVGASFFNKNLFNIRFYMTNLRQPRVLNKREVVEADRVDGVDKLDGSKVDRKKPDGPDIATEDPVAENSGIVPEDLTSEDSAMVENLSIEDNLLRLVAGKQRLSS